MNGFIDLLLQNMSGGRPQRATADITAGREGFGIRKPGRTDILPPPTRINPGLINLPNARRPQQELPVIDQTDIDTPTEDIDVTATYQQPQTSQSENILRQTMQSIADLQNKEYTQGKGGFKDILKGLGLGALDAFSKADPRQGLAGMLGAATGGAAGLGIRSAIDSSADDRFIDERKMNKLYQDAAAQGQIADSEKGRVLKDAQIAIAQGKPDIAKQDALRKQRETDIKEFRAINDAEYKTNLISLGQEKADEVKKNNERMFILKQRGADQEDQRIVLLRERNAEIMRNNQARLDQTERKGMPKNNVPLPPSTMKTPATVPAKTALENGLTSRGIKPGSPEWNKVMQAAGY